MMVAARPFHLVRDIDVTGVSGTGVIADGVEWPDGSVAVRWRGHHASLAVWDSIVDVRVIHGHRGATRIVWVDLAFLAAHDAPACRLSHPPPPCRTLPMSDPLDRDASVLPRPPTHPT